MRQDPAADLIVGGSVRSTATAAAVVQGESNQEYVLRRTRDINVAIREHPENLQLWLKYASWQEEASKLLHVVRRGPAGDAAVLERKMSVLETALKHHPGEQRVHQTT